MSIYLRIGGENDNLDCERIHVSVEDRKVKENVELCKHFKPVNFTDNVKKVTENVVECKGEIKVIKGTYIKYYGLTYISNLNNCVRNWRRLRWP